MVHSDLIAMCLRTPDEITAPVGFTFVTSKINVSGHTLPATNERGGSHISGQLQTSFVWLAVLGVATQASDKTTRVMMLVFSTKTCSSLKKTKDTSFVLSQKGKIDFRVGLLRLF